ncbi:transposase [Nonomuraea muscovyensis]|uniref:transposase n=1 Tax=Nonomuraea muscovyensis TaxID=1124761 RepID=UPI0033DF0F3A
MPPGSCRTSPSRWRCWGSMRPAAAGHDGASTNKLRPGRPWRTAGTSALSTCPAGRGCSARSKAGPARWSSTGWTRAGRSGSQRVSHGAIDRCAIYKAAVRAALPHAVLVVDHFLIVQLANAALPEVRRR